MPSSLKFSEVNDVQAIWFYNDELYQYISREKTVIYHKKNNSISASLYPKGRNEDTDVLIMEKNDGNYFFKHTCTEPKKMNYEYSLKKYSSEYEIILHHYDKKNNEIIYFHLS